MADALQRFERLIESVVGGVVGRTTNLKLHPIEMAKRIGAAMDAEEVVGIGGRVAPNAYTVQMSDVDLRAFGGATASLERELVRYLTEIAAERRSHFLAPPRVRLEARPGVPRGSIRVRAEHAPPAADSMLSTVRRDESAEWTPPPAEAIALEPTTRTLGLVATDGTGWPLQVGETLFGRALESDVMLGDPSVSRRHARLVFDGRSCTIEDLGSTNGTYVNSRRVQTANISPGDAITLGVVELRLEVGPRTDIER